MWLLRFRWVELSQQSETIEVAEEGLGRLKFVVLL